MHDQPLESDWKIFRKRIPEWRDRYLHRANSDIIAVLNNNNGTPTERFWNAKERMDEEAKKLAACLDGHSRSKMYRFLSSMLRYGLIEEPDLTEFSEELQQRIGI